MNYQRIKEAAKRMAEEATYILEFEFQYRGIDLKCQTDFAFGEHSLLNLKIWSSRRKGWIKMPFLMETFLQENTSIYEYLETLAEDKMDAVAEDYINGWGDMEYDRRREEEG